MSWYIILAIVWGSFAFVGAITAWIKEKSFSLALAFFVFLITVFPVTPIILVREIIKCWYLERYKYDSFTISDIDEGLRQTLIHLGFEEGKFVSRANQEYTGFRYRLPGRKITEITVTNTGRVTIWGNQSAHIKELKQILFLAGEINKTLRT